MKQYTMAQLLLIFHILNKYEEIPDPASRFMDAVRSGEISPDEFLQTSLNDDTRYFMDLNRKQGIDT